MAAGGERKAEEEEARRPVRPRTEGSLREEELRDNLLFALNNDGLGVMEPAAVGPAAEPAATERVWEFATPFAIKQEPRSPLHSPSVEPPPGLAGCFVPVATLVPVCMNMNSMNATEANDLAQLTAELKERQREKLELEAEQCDLLAQLGELSDPLDGNPAQELTMYAFETL